MKRLLGFIEGTVFATLLATIGALICLLVVALDDLGDGSISRGIKRAGKQDANKRKRKPPVDEDVLIMGFRA